MLKLKPLVIGELTPPLNIKVIKTKEDLSLLENFFKRKKEFCLDIETNYETLFHKRKVRSIQFGDKDEQYVVDLLYFAKDGNLITTQGQYDPHSCYTNLINVIKPVLESGDYLKIAYNAIFEYTNLRWNLGLRTWNFYDPLLFERLLYCGEVPFKFKNFWGLEDTFARYFGVAVDKSQQKTFGLISELTEEQIQYAALDVRLPAAIKSKQLALLGKLKEPIVLDLSSFTNFHNKIKGPVNLEKVMQIEFACTPALGDVELNGLLLNEEKWQKLIKAVEVDYANIIKELDEEFIPVPTIGRKQIPNFDLTALEAEWRDCTEKGVRKEKHQQFIAARKEVNAKAKRIDSCQGEAFLNYASTKQLKKAMIEWGIPAELLPDTEERTLSRIASQYSVVPKVQKMRSVQKLLSTYGQPFIDAINELTGRIHTRTNQIGAETGRPTSVDQNIFNIPKEDRWRQGIEARPGYTMITSDFSGQELRIATEFSQDPVLIQAFKNNWDVHSYVAEMMFGKEWEDLAQPDCAYYTQNKKKCKCVGHTEAFNKGTNQEKKSLRDKTKSINFGILFGMNVSKLSDELKVSKAEAKLLLKKYNATLPVLMNYLNQSGKKCVFELIARTIGGRIRRFRQITPELTKKKLMEDLLEEDPELEITEADLKYEQIKVKKNSLESSIERVGRNMPIQGTGADMLKLAMGASFDEEGKPFLWHILPKYKAHLLNTVYDELLIECPTEKAEELAGIIKERMIKAASTFVKVIPFDVEQQLDKCWRK